MDIAITGSSGLIGTALRRHLTAGGHRVLRVVRSEPSGSDEIAWDPAGGTIDAAGLEGVDAVVHLAGAGIGDKRWTPERKQVIFDSRIESTTLLTETLVDLEHPPRVLLSGSAVGYYGDQGDTTLDETDGAGDDFLAELCVEWEARTRPAEQAGIRVVHLRNGIVLSPDGGALAKMLPLFKLGLGGPIAGGDQYWAWISIDDEVRAIEFLLTADVEGPVNLTGPEPVTNQTFTKALGSVLHRPTILPVPKFGPALLLGRELADSLLDTSGRVVPAVLQNAGYPFLHRVVRTALAELLGKEQELT